MLSLKDTLQFCSIDTITVQVLGGSLVKLQLFSVELKNHPEQSRLTLDLADAVLSNQLIEFLPCAMCMDSPCGGATIASGLSLAF